MRVKQWRCTPCRERSRLKRLAVLAATAAGEEVEDVGTAGRYRLLRGVKHRIEDGVVKEYRTGDVMELSASEAATLRYSIEPVATELPPSRAEIRSTRPEHATFQEMSAGDAAGYVLAAPDVTSLDELESIESSGRARKTVFRAIEERRTTLTDATEEVGDE